MTSVLVTDGEQRSALAVVRSLGKVGHAVYVGSDRRASLAGASRYTRGTAMVPNALGSAGEYADAVQALVKRWGINVLLPVTDASVLALLPRRSDIPAL